MNTPIKTRTNSKTEQITLSVYQLGCGGGGARSLEHRLTQTPGLVQVTVNPVTDKAYIEYDPNLIDPSELGDVIERAGYGYPDVNPRETMPVTVGTTNRLDISRLTLAAGLWLAALYVLCIITDLIFPNLFQMYRFWELFLIGFDWGNRWTLWLGLVEAFLYGALGAWSLAAIYSALPERAVR